MYPGRGNIFKLSCLDFDMDGRPDNISFMIKRIKVHTGDALTDPTYRLRVVIFQTSFALPLWISWVYLPQTWNCDFGRRDWPETTLEWMTKYYKDSGMGTSSY